MGKYYINKSMKSSYYGWIYIGVDYLNETLVACKDILGGLHAISKSSLKEISKDDYDNVKSLILDDRNFEIDVAIQEILEGEC